jgi:hypothetical protein
MMVSKNNSSRNGIISTATISGNTIDYSGHLSDSKIRTDDVPLLADQVAPVENLLNPITSQPYNIEQKQIAMNTKVDPYSIEGIMLILVLPILIAGLWIFYMQSVWKRRSIQHDRLV